MEQLNIVSPASQEESFVATGTSIGNKPESPLLNKVHQNFGIYGLVSLIFGLSFTFFFFKTWLGFNVFVFSLLIIILLCFIINKLSLRIKTGTKLYYIGVLLLGVSTCLTANGVLQFLNILGILFLLDLSLLHQFYENKHWDFAKHCGRMFGMIFYSFAAVGTPVIDGIKFLKSTRYLKNDKVRNIIFGLIISLPLLLIITILLSNADLVFDNITGNIFNTIFSADIFYIILMIIFGFFACYCILCGALFNSGVEDNRIRTKANPTIAATFMVVLCLIYALFCGIQLVFLFADGLFALPAEFTFAEYARKGFFELLAVTFINIVIMLICNALFTESRLLRILITCMTACTYIMITSATYRMLLYIGAYHLTFLRLFVLLTLLIDAFVLTGIIILQYKKDFPLFRYCVVIISVCYIAFSFAKPDYFIATYLATQKEVLDQQDMAYLTRDLSLDAAPVVLPLINELDRWTMNNTFDSEYDTRPVSLQDSIQDYSNRIANAKINTGIRDFNYSYFKAGKLAGKYLKEY